MNYIWHVKIPEDFMQGDNYSYIPLNIDTDYAADKVYTTIHYQ